MLLPGGQADFDQAAHVETFLRLGGVHFLQLVELLQLLGRFPKQVEFAFNLVECAIGGERAGIGILLPPTRLDHADTQKTCPMPAEMPVERIPPAQRTVDEQLVALGNRSLGGFSACGHVG